MQKNLTLIFGFAATLMACSSQPKTERPAWISQPTRIVDNGYIVYVGTAEDTHPEQAQFKAEGLALEDLANECSFAPKGTRIEDRYTEKEKYYTKSYVKIGLEFTECEKAKHTNDPSTIKELASSGFTEQIRRYQDLIENGEAPETSQYAALEVPKELPPVPASAGMTETTHFYVVRQYVAYQKEIVILSPPSTYAVNSEESHRFTTALQPAIAQVETYQTQNPALVKEPMAWSKLPDRPKIARPEILRASAPTPHNSYKPVSKKYEKSSANKNSSLPHEGKKKKKKKRF
jgi:hypothetical protein